MRDYCVAISALIPLLLLLVVVDSRLVKRERTGGADHPALGGMGAMGPLLVSAVWMFVMPVLVIASVLTLLVMIIAIPFVPDGSPSGWIWVIFILPLPSILFLLLLAAYALIGTTFDDL